jgi:hypothetical protein
MTRYIFVNCISDGPIDWKRSLTAEGQPAIRECHMIVQGDDDGPQVIEELSGTDATTLARYANLISNGYVVVGHSVNFHAGALRAAMIPWGIDPCDGRTKTICTMLALTGHVTKRNGKKGWPTFDEACDFFCITRAGTETAEDNARCLMQVFRGMEKIGAVPEPLIWKDRNA